jgi:hypothetical protein
VQSGEFDVTWLAGSKNIADCSTKPLPTAKHKEIQALLMAPTEPVIAAPNGPTQQHHVTSQSFNNIFDVFYDEDDDDEEYIRSNTMHGVLMYACITTHSNNIAVSIMLITNHGGLYGLILYCINKRIPISIASHST